MSSPSQVVGGLALGQTPVPSGPRKPVQAGVVGSAFAEASAFAKVSADETADVGVDLGTPVVEAIGSEHASRFTGHIPKVTVEVRP